MDEPVAAISVRAWKPPVPGVREVLHATFADHAYPPHTHDVWTLFVVDEGAIRYDLDRTARGASPSMVSVLPPHVVHDGRPANGDGYRKRVIYLETSVLGEPLIGAAVDQPVLRDPSLRGLVDALDAALACPDDALEAEVRLAGVAERIRASLGSRRPSARRPWRPRARRTAPRLARRAHVRCSDLGGGRRRARRRPDPPRANLRRRVRDPSPRVPRRPPPRGRARPVLAGQPLADVAAEVGYVDQAHLTRRFRRFLGTTPGRFGGGG